MALSAVLRKAGHVPRVAIAAKPEATLREVEFFRPGVIGFSFTNCEEGWVLDAARAIRARYPGIPMIAGGPHPTLHPELARREGIDVVCRGEGEYSLLEYVEAVEKGGDGSDVPNLCFVKDGELVRNPVRPLVEDLDALPFHDWELYYRHPFLRTNPVKYFFSGRGCPYNCSFCFNREYKEIYPNKQKYIRKWSVARVMAEIEDVRSRYPMRFVRFEDDVFTLKKSWLAEFLPRYRREIGLPFLCYLRAGESEETIAALKEAGCHTVLFGIETGDEARRNDLLGKGVTNDQIRDTARLLHKHRIHFFTTNMLGLPGETWETAMATLRLNQAIRVPDTWCSVFQPYAGLPITRYAVEQGYLTESAEGAIGFNTFSDNVLKQQDADRIFNLHKFFYPLARWPWLSPVLLPLTKLRKNALFHYVFVFFYAVSYLQHTRIGPARLAREGARWFRLFLAERRA
jgi:radical SAM superfamily enzyme YgiQ (UPF0313 family)